MNFRNFRIWKVGANFEVIFGETKKVFFPLLSQVLTTAAFGKQLIFELSCFLHLFLFVLVLICVFSTNSNLQVRAPHLTATLSKTKLKLQGR